MSFQCSLVKEKNYAYTEREHGDILLKTLSFQSGRMGPETHAKAGGIEKTPVEIRSRVAAERRSKGVV